MTNKLKIIILSSSKIGLPIAESLKKSLLEDGKDIEVTIWNEDPIFQPASFTLPRLLEIKLIFDFAVVILTPDDFIKPSKSDKSATYAPRDNVIFEMGLFMSSLGIERTFILRQGDVKLPTDISGLFYTQFDVDLSRFDASIKEKCTSKILKYLTDNKIEPFTFSNNNQSKTNSLGDIPYLLPQAVKLLKQAKRGDSLKICCDFPAYGCFSCPETWLEYIHEIEMLETKGVELTFICANDDVRLEVSDWQFPKEHSLPLKWKKFKERRIDESQPTYQDNINTLITLIKKEKRLHKYISKKMKIPTNPTREELIQLMEFADQYTYLNIPNSEKKEYISPIPIYYWIFETQRPGQLYKEAVFALACFDDKRFEYGFHTTDLDFIKALEKLPIKYSKID